MSLNFVILRHVGIISRQKRQLQKSYKVNFIALPCSKTYVFCKACENCQKSGFISKHKESLNNILLTFETYPGGDVHCAIHDL
jgi:hypothetical protein